MTYTPVYENFEVVGQDGQRREVRFKRAGFLAAGDEPEIYFFGLGGQEVAVGISGESLRQFQRRWRYLSREEKIDLAGLFLTRQIGPGGQLVSENLYIRGEELERLARDLGFLP